MRSQGPNSTNGTVGCRGVSAQSPGMKRLLATALWTYALWYLGAAISLVFGLPDLLGPILGLATGLLVGLDPRHVFWHRPAHAGWTAT